MTSGLPTLTIGNLLDLLFAGGVGRGPKARDTAVADVPPFADLLRTVSGQGGSDSGTPPEPSLREETSPLEVEEAEPAESGMAALPLTVPICWQTAPFPPENPLADPAPAASGTAATLELPSNPDAAATATVPMLPVEPEPCVPSKRDSQPALPPAGGCYPLSAEYPAVLVADAPEMENAGPKDAPTIRGAEGTTTEAPLPFRARVATPAERTRLAETPNEAAFNLRPKPRPAPVAPVEVASLVPNSAPPAAAMTIPESAAIRAACVALPATTSPIAHNPVAPAEHKPADPPEENEPAAGPKPADEGSHIAAQPRTTVFPVTPGKPREDRESPDPVPVPRPFAAVVRNVVPVAASQPAVTLEMPVVAEEVTAAAPPASPSPAAEDPVQRPIPRATDLQYVFEAPGRQLVGLRVKSVGGAVQVTVQGVDSKLRPGLSRELPELVQSLNRDGWEVAATLSSGSKTAVSAGPVRPEPEVLSPPAVAADTQFSDRQSGGRHHSQGQGDSQRNRGGEPAARGAGTVPVDNLFADTLALASRRENGSRERR